MNDTTCVKNCSITIQKERKNQNVMYIDTTKYKNVTNELNRHKLVWKGYHFTFEYIKELT